MLSKSDLESRSLSHHYATLIDWSMSTSFLFRFVSSGLYSCCRFSNLFYSLVFSCVKLGFTQFSHITSQKSTQAPDPGLLQEARLFVWSLIQLDYPRGPMSVLLWALQTSLTLMKIQGLPPWVPRRTTSVHKSYYQKSGFSYKISESFNFVRTISPPSSFLSGFKLCMSGFSYKIFSGPSANCVGPHWVLIMRSQAFHTRSSSPSPLQGLSSDHWLLCVSLGSEMTVTTFKVSYHLHFNSPNLWTRPVHGAHPQYNDPSL